MEAANSELGHATTSAQSGFDLQPAASCWSPSPPAHLVADILSLIPEDVTSVLDVGCGDGRVINALPDRLEVLGFDTTAPALQHVRRPTCKGSIAQLPFPDGAFDLVMCNDLIARLDDDELRKAIFELSRVAKRYLLLTVPNAEQLDANLTKCAECGTTYHVDRHRRSVNEQQLLALSNGVFRPLEIRYSGDPSRSPFDMTVQIRHAMNLFRESDRALCPKCGSARQVASHADAMRRSIDSLRSSRWARRQRDGLSTNDRTQLIGLFARDVRAGHPPAAPRSAGRASLLHIDFANPLQAAVPDVSPGNSWARFGLPPGVEQDGQGARRSPAMASAATVPVWFPVESRQGDRILLEISGSGEVKLASVDGATGLRETLLACPASAARQVYEVLIHQPWSPGRCGLAVEIALPEGLTLHSVQYKSAEGERYHRDMVLLHRGHNVAPLATRDGVNYTWGFLAPGEGRHPRPALPFPETTVSSTRCNEVVPLLTAANLRLERHLRGDRAPIVRPETEPQEPACRSCQEARLAALGIDEHGLALTPRVCGICDKDSPRLPGNAALLGSEDLCATLCQLLEIKEEQRLAAQRAYEVQATENHALRQQLEQNSGVRGRTKELYRAVKRRIFGPKLPIEEYFPPAWTSWDPDAAEERGEKVLVLSHMFPHPDQPSSGPFVLEQVKALREHAGIDARVLTGRPFWMNRGQSFIGYWSLNDQYRRLHAAQTWKQLDGVPVLYLPYQVCLGFWNHRRMYRSAMLRRIEEIREQFPFTCVHAHTSFLDGGAGQAIAQRYNVPLFITEHTNPFAILTQQRLVRKGTLASLNFAERVIAVSEAQRRDVLPSMAPGREDRLIVMPNGVDTSAFVPSRRRANPEAPRLLYIGFFADYKNVPLLLDAFAGVVRQVPGASLWLIGKGEGGEEASLRAMADRLGLRQHVTFLGSQSRESVARILREDVDMLVLSSRTESFGCVLIEAMACGLPVVSTRSGGPDDIVTEPFLGRLCENNSPEALAQAILEVISNHEKFDRRRIRRHVEERFSYASLAAGLADLYGQILGRSLSKTRAAA